MYRRWCSNDCIEPDSASPAGQSYLLAGPPHIVNTVVQSLGQVNRDAVEAFGVSAEAIANATFGSASCSLFVSVGLSPAAGAKARADEEDDC